MKGKRMYLAPKSENYCCFSWSAGETAHSLWSSLTQLRSAVRNMRISGGSWGMLPSPEFSNLPLFPSHPLQTSLSPTIPIDSQRGAISRFTREGELRIIIAEARQYPHCWVSRARVLKATGFINSPASWNGAPEHGQRVWIHEALGEKAWKMGWVFRDHVNQELRVDTIQVRQSHSSPVGSWQQ